MAKTVFDNRQTAHVWASQAQPRGQSHNGNFSFSGPVIFSYSTPVARFVAAADGSRVVLVTSDRSGLMASNTTQGKHMPAVRSAVRGSVSFDVAEIEPTTAAHHESNFAELIARHDSALATLRRNKVFRESEAWRTGLVYQLEWLAKLAAEPADYARLFELTSDNLPDYESDVAALADHAREAYAKWNAGGAGEKRRAKREAAATAKAKREEADRLARLAGYAQAVAEWRAGVRHAVPAGAALLADGSAMLRVRAGKLETSQGASVPLPEAVAVFRFVKLVRERGQPWQRNGESIRVGSFAVDSIAADGTMRAGCHVIGWPEIESAAVAASVANAEPSAAVLIPGNH